jgi:DNA-binding MarR family transcriptional regulator
MNVAARRTTDRAPNTSTCPWADLGSQGEHLGVEDLPSFILIRLANSLQREVTSTYLEAFDLTTPQWRTLAALAVHTPIAFGELVRLSLSDKALVSRSTQALARRGLAKVEADPEHGKKMVCTVTAKGRTLYQRVLARAQQAQSEILRRLEPEDRVALYHSLQKLRDALASRPAA